MKKVALCGVFTVICIIAAVFLRKNMDSAELDYKEVKVYVVSSETKERTVRTKYSTTRQTYYEIVVSYDGKEYDLKNAHNSYSWRKGSMATAYLSHGKMYANIEGVRSSSASGIAYSAALIASFVMFFVTTWLWGKAIDKKKAEKKAALSAENAAAQEASGDASAKDSAGGGI